MSDLIGTFTTTRPACEDIHIPGCYNVWADTTWCLCGDHQWPGEQATLHTRHLYNHSGPGAQLVGYDVYWMGPIG